MTEEALIDGYSSPLAYINITTSDERIEFLSNTGFGSLLVNSLVTVNGKTIGECNRALLHDKLDAWLNKTWEQSND